MSRRRSQSWALISLGLVAIVVAFVVVSSAIHSQPEHRRGSDGDKPKQHVHGHGPSSSSPQPLGIPGDWKMVLNSDFSRRPLDTAIWRTGWFGSGITGPINKNEVACYSSANVALAQDALSLAVTDKPSSCANKTRPYTGAVLSTNPRDGRAAGGFAYRYGVLEAKVYVPAAANSEIADWPGVIALGQVWPRDGEDDVMENLDGVVCSHFHSPGYAPGGNLGGCDPGFTPGWHVVSSDWKPGSASWYYDGIQIAHANKGITSSPMYIVLVNTVSKKAPQVDRPDAMRVAYVRVWQRRAPAGAR